MNQREMVVEFIKNNGCITSFQAYSIFGITQLATRISELKDLGYVFEKKRIYTKNRFGKRTHYDEYYIKEIEK